MRTRSANSETDWGSVLITLNAAGNAFDFCSEEEELFVDHFVATIDVVEAVDLGGAFGGESSENKSGGGSEVGGHDASGTEFFDSLNDGAAIINFYVCSHATELGTVHEALWKDRVFNY